MPAILVGYVHLLLIKHATGQFDTKRCMPCQLQCASAKRNGNRCRSRPYQTAPCGGNAAHPIGFICRTQSADFATSLPNDRVGFERRKFASMIGALALIAEQ